MQLLISELSECVQGVPWTIDCTYKEYIIIKYVQRPNEVDATNYIYKSILMLLDVIYY